MIRRQAIVLLALVGLLVATYLWLYKIGVLGVLQCGTGSCESVQASRYAELFGIPVAFYGVAGYAALMALGLASLQPRFAAEPLDSRSRCTSPRSSCSCCMRFAGGASLPP